MRKSVSPKLRGFAKAMRKDPTDGEAHLWEMLCRKKLAGMRFRRQHPIENYIVDFICLDEKLIIEVDGSQHAESRYDQNRDTRLTELGFQVLHFWNDEIIKNSGYVAQKILHCAGKKSM